LSHSRDSTPEHRAAPCWGTCPRAGRRSMLYADKNALRTQLKVNMLKIRERELRFYTNNCLSISTSAALLAGFAWYGLTEVPFDEQADAVIQTMYLVVTTLIMGLELLTVVNATLCAILGPGLALRGPDGSMHTAVHGMMTHYKFTLVCFTGGLVCFMLSALLYGWMQFSIDLALPLTILLVYFLYKIFAYFTRIFNRFRLDPNSVVTGAFMSDSQRPPSDERQNAVTPEQRREQDEQAAEARRQYDALPESVKMQMGGGAGPPR